MTKRHLIGGPMDGGEFVSDALQIIVRDYRYRNADANKAGRHHPYSYPWHDIHDGFGPERAMYELRSDGHYHFDAVGTHNLAVKY